MFTIMGIMYIISLILGAIKMDDMKDDKKN